MAFEFNNPLLYELREGSALDPYASKVDTSVITNNKIILSELPDQFSGITIPNYSESKSPSDLISTSFYCNYLNGTLSFSSTENGKTVTATYLGRGIIAIPAERIYTKSVDGSSTETFQQVADNVGNASTVLSNLSSSISTGNVTNSNLISSISTANSTKTDLNNMNIIAIETEASLSSANVVASEATRIQNESQRLLNEGIRVNSEVTRVSAENIRKSAEEIRIPAEVNRNNAESARLIAENLRIAQNNNSISAENIRIASENERIDEEVVRQDNENTRLSQESSRIIAESSRVGVENTRVSQELSRVGVENTRVTSENIRLASEISRVGVESARVSAENIRESNEETRISQENTREINEDSRISDESNREANELTRISQENIRESQEENRQSTYSSGHISFKGVVTGIASLPTSSNILGDTYQVIDDAITANNAMWRYSGTIFEKSYVLDLTFAGGYGANNSQVFTATEGQTVFTLTEFPYLVNVNQLMVYVAGIKQIIGINYTETSTNSFTLTSGVVAGTKVEAFRSVPGGAGSLTTQEVENARVSSLGVGYANLKARIDAHDFEKVGVLSGLPTVVKTDVVSSINEFYDDVASYKEDNATHEKFIKIVNATNIQDAIDSFTSGGTVILANGEYEIDPFEITNDYVTVKSDGLTILKCKQAYSLVDGDYDVCGQGNIIHAVGRKGITLKNITLKGSYDQLKHFKQNVYDKVVPTEMGYKLLNFDSCESIKLISFNIINSYSNYVDRGLMTNYDFFRSVYGFNPFGISNSKNILLQDCEWKESDGEAWQIFNSTDITVTGCKFNVVFCVSMLDLTFCKDLTITNNQFKRTLTTGGNLVNLASANYIFADNLVINGLVDIGNESLNEGIDVGINFSCENIQIHDNTIINGCLTDQTSNDSYNALYTLRNVTIGGNAIRYNLDDMDQSDIGSIFFIKGILIGPYGKFKDIEISNNKISVEGTLTHTNSRLQLIGVMCDTVSLISDRNTEEVVIKDNVIDTSKMIFDKLFFPNSSGAILLVGHSILNNVTIKGNKIKCHLGIEFIAVSTIEDMTISNNEYYSGVTPIESINSQDCIYKGYHTFINYNLPNGVTIKDLQIRDNISECIGFLTLSNFASLDTYNFKNISIRENKHTTKAYTSSDGVIRAVRLMKDQITFNGATIDMIGNTFINENAIAVGLALYYTERVILDDNIFLGKHSLTLSNSASNVATGVVIIKDNYADDFAKSYTNLPNKTNITKNSSAFSAGLLPTLPLDEVYYDSVTNTLKAWNGAIWKTSVALT